MIGFLTTLAANPVGHVVDKPLITSPDGALWYVSNVTVMLVLSAIVTLLIILPAAKKIATGGQQGGRSVDDYRAQGLWANAVESSVCCRCPPGR